MEYIWLVQTYEGKGNDLRLEVHDPAPHSNVGDLIIKIKVEAAHVVTAQDALANKESGSPRERPPGTY